MLSTSLAAETLALSDAFENRVHLLQMLLELLYNNTCFIPMETVNDSKLLHDALHSKKNITKICTS